MPFDAADFDRRGRPAPGRGPRRAPNLFLHKLALFLARAAFLGIVLVFAAHAVAVATGGRPECAAHGPVQAGRQASAQPKTTRREQMP